MKKRIFIVEDDDDIREIVTLVLEGEQYEVIPNSTISEFEQKFNQHKPDAILLDIRLPDGNGMELCTLLKSQEQTRHIPVIMMSAHEQIAIVMQNCKAESFISKPFDIDDLLSKVQLYA